MLRGGFCNQSDSRIQGGCCYVILSPMSGVLFGLFFTKYKRRRYTNLLQIQGVVDAGLAEKLGSSTSNHEFLGLIALLHVMFQCPSNLCAWWESDGICI